MGIIFFRTVIIFILLLAAMRIMGKRQLGQLELSELVVTVLISDIASHPLQDIGIPLLNAIVPIVTLLCCELLISMFMMKSIRFRILMCGKPSIVIDHGKIVQKEMKKNCFTLDELTEELRKQNITDLSTIKYAILETDGTLNPLLFPEEMPVTAKMMQLQVEDTGFPSIVINDGRVLDNNLMRLGLDKKWLENQLKQRKITNPKDVYLLMVDNTNKVYFSAKEAQ